MPTTQKSDSQYPNEVLFKPIRLILISIVAIAFGILIGFFDIVFEGVISTLLFGWKDFGVKVLTAITIRWDSVLVFAAGFAVATLSLHVLLSWLIKERFSKTVSGSALDATSNDANQVRWSIWSSVAATTMILFVFVVGISMTGVVHQTGWILSGSGSDSFADGMVQAEQDARLSRYDPANPLPGESWIVAIGSHIPYQMPELNSPNDPFNAPANANQFKNKFVREVLCPLQATALSRDGYGLSHTVANPKLLGKSLKVRNGATILAGEINAGFDPWAAPLNARSPELGLRQNWAGTAPDQVGFGSQHVGGTQVVNLDGSTHFLSYDVAPEVLRRLSNPPKQDD